MDLDRRANLPQPLCNLRVCISSDPAMLHSGELDSPGRRGHLEAAVTPTGWIAKDENVSILAAARGAIMMSCLIGKSI